MGRNEAGEILSRINEQENLGKNGSSIYGTF
jgi:hypothetical protein